MLTSCTTAQRPFRSAPHPRPARSGAQEPLGLYDCAYALDMGSGSPVNVEAAFLLYLSAAKVCRRVGKFECEVGRCYFRGIGCKASVDAAVKWYTRAARHGDQDAQAALGVCSYNGNGVARDTAQAVRWWTAAALQMHVRAMHLLGLTYLAIESAQRAHDIGQELLAMAYFSGRESALDCFNGEYWLRRLGISGGNGNERRRDVDVASWEGWPTNLKAYPYTTRLRNWLIEFQRRIPA
jgi:TPR repeat protein